MQMTLSGKKIFRCVMNINIVYYIASDYGYMHSDGFTGACVRDELISLEDPCAQGKTGVYKKSQGYRKVAGDVCGGGEESAFVAIDSVCCGELVCDSAGECVTCFLSSQQQVIILQSLFLQYSCLLL